MCQEIKIPKSPELIGKDFNIVVREERQRIEKEVISAFTLINAFLNNISSKFDMNNPYEYLDPDELEEKENLVWTTDNLKRLGYGLNQIFRSKEKKQ